MNQVERDLTYRLDALKATCSQYGLESEMCKNSMQLWQEQHDWNVKYEKYSDYFGLGLSLFLFIMLLPFLVGKILVYLDKHKNQGRKF